MRKSNWTHHVIYVCIAAALLFTAACSGAATVTVQASPTVTTTPAATTTPGGNNGNNGTPISGPPATSCSAVLTGAGTASAGANFTDLPLPPNSVSTPVAKTKGGGDGQFAIYEQDVCTTGTSSQAIFTFFANTLPANNWPQQKWFPFDGYFYADCGDPFCWASGGSAPPRYVGLEAVTSHGNGIVSYHLRLATPPAAPTCGGGGTTFSPGYYYNLQDLAKYTKTSLYQQIPLPPLTRIVHDDATGHIGFDLCSAPSLPTITSFMSQHLTALGWHQVNATLWSNGAFQLTVLLNSSTDWIITYLNPDI